MRASVRPLSPALVLAVSLCALGCRAGAQPYRRGTALNPSALMLLLPSENPFPEAGRCGLNALWKVLRYHDRKVEPAAMLKLAPSPVTDDSADFELAALARRLGFACTFGRATPEAVAGAVELARPVLALTPTFGPTRRLHWVVIHGMDAERRLFWVDLGSDGEVGTIGMDTFDRLWRQCGRRAVFVSGRQTHDKNGEVTK